ncbi:MAG: DUF434 domain-containing protein [Candidatus Odinarchaeota archaeon]|nr:DUF434 domain-containing protein [Candidatus Odinarchaeota archaeon]
MSVKITETILEAAIDLKYLLDRGYPKKYALTFVCNHRLLSREMRDLLSRVIYSKDVALKRCKKLVPPCKINAKKIVIDGFNVLITIEAMLQGHPLFMGNDCIVRDLERSHGKYKKSKLTEIALFLILYELKELNPSEVTFFFDSQVSHSKRILKYTECLSKKLKVISKFYLERTVDSILKTVYSNKEYVILTSDSVIIDSATYVFDLPRYVANSLNYPLISLINPECEHE